MRQLKITKNITNRDGASLDRYLSEVARQPMVTAEEETELARRIREGDDAALVKLTTANLRFVVSVAKQFQNQGLSLSDLINEGNIGLIKAARRFDETRGFKFISYAVWWIRQSVMQAVAEQSRIVRLPLNKVGAISKIRKMQAAMEQDLERQPTAFELSEAMESSEKEITNTISASFTHLSTDMPVSDDSYTLGDMLPDRGASQPDDLLILESRRAEIDSALSALSGQEKDVVMMFFGVGHPHSYSLHEIGEKYDLSTERVRQIREKAIRKLRHHAENNELKTYL